MKKTKHRVPNSYALSTLLTELTVSLKKLGLAAPVVSSIEKSIKSDGVLPLIVDRLTLSDKVSVTLDDENNKVVVSIGPRDWEFDGNTGERSSAGTFFSIGGPVAEVPKITRTRTRQTAAGSST